MTEPNSSRPGSSAAVYQASSVPPSPRPSVASRASRSSLRRDHDRHDGLPHHHQPPSSAHPQPPRATDDHAAQPPLPPPHIDPLPFKPLFSLVATSAHPSPRQTTQHPILHYVFVDDDPELLTEALAQHYRAADELSGEYSRERAVIVDLAPSDHGPGYTVERASSLSPDWAVVSATIGRMEDINGTLAAAHGDSQGALMLKIEGFSMESSSPTPSGKSSTPEGELQGSGTKPPRPQQVAEEYSVLLSDFDKRMGVLRRVMDAGGETQRPGTTRGEGPEEQTSARFAEEKDELKEEH
ncbi:hypothetical protein QBC34DRAFT_40918 [Podospora aff. communis PSN243]|uniref:Uncharacterized protein n=1 Tax=Podospora aff. communis PSN243 TaxID=3040156 RepID=A0AAV9GV13_9PEZI|nr:hypothetical protein QBC34DRAFT_40918 [Podospora aff. communis PSN243]